MSRTGEGSADVDAEDLREALGSDRTSEVIEAIGRFGQVSEEEDVDALRRTVPTATSLLSHPNAYVQKQAASRLEEVADNHPAIFEEQISELVQRFGEEVEHADDIVSVLSKVIDRDEYNLDTETIDSLIRLMERAHDTTTRRCICKLMGNCVYLRSAKMLQETHEIDPAVNDVAKEELSQMVQRSVHALQAGADSPDAEPVKVLRFIGQKHPSMVASRGSDLVELLGESPDGVRLVLDSLKRWEEIHGSELKDILSQEIWDPDVGCEEDRLAAEASLRILIEYDIGESEAGEIANRYSSDFQKADVEIREHATLQVRRLAQAHPDSISSLREELGEAVQSESEYVSRNAYIALQEVIKAKGDRLERARQLSSELGMDSFVAGLGGEIDLLRYDNESGMRGMIDTGSVGRSILEDLTREASRCRSIPIVFPRFSPKGVIAIVVELIGGITPESGDDIALYSPGTRTQWGLKRQLKEEYRRYSLAEYPGDESPVTPISEMVPPARIDESGEVITYEGDGSGGRLVLSKDVEELLSIDGDRVGAIVLNMAATSKAGAKDQLSSLQEQFEVPIVPIYTPYTKHDAEGYPRYGPPEGLGEVQTLPSYQAFETVSMQEEGPRTDDDDHPIASDAAVHRGGQQRTIEVIGVDGGGLSDRFESVYEISGKLRNEGLTGPASKVFSVQFLFERLPIPSDTFDNRIYERRRDGEVYLPWTTSKYISNLREYAGNVKDRRAPGELFRAAGLLEGICEDLAEDNPMSSRLVEIVSASLAQGDDVVVFTHKSGWSGIISRHLDNVLDSHGGDLRVMGPDEARGLTHADRLVATGPIPRQLAGYYLLPTIDKTTVLTYDGAWGGLIERHATEFTDRMNEAIDGPGFDFYPEPQVEVDWDGPSVQEATPEDASHSPVADVKSPKTPTASPRSDGRRHDDLERLAEAFENTTVGEYSEDKERYHDDTYRRYKVLTLGDFHLELTSNETYLRRRNQGGYHWASPGTLQTGDVVAVLDDDVETNLWSHHLEKLYSEGMVEADATAGVRIWYRSLEEILEEVAQDLDDGSDEDQVIDSIVSSMIASGIDRTEGTIRSWFTAVQLADGALDLARDSSLRIGPRDAGDVRAVGEVFGKDELETEFERVERSMNAVRHLNQREGRALRDDILELIEAKDDERVESLVAHHEIAEINLVQEEDG